MQSLPWSVFTNFAFDVGQSLLVPSISRILANAECVATGKFSVLLDIKHDESVDEVRQIPAIKV